MDTIINKHINLLLGNRCCRRQVGNNRSLSLGFGKKIYHDEPQTRLRDEFYGEWEIGTYYRSWRVIKDNKIICGSNDSVDSIEELDAALNQIDFGIVESLVQTSSFDVRVNLDNGISVDFLSTIKDDDEIFHLFCPDNLCVIFSIHAGWRLFKSDEGLDSQP